jgi:hypothetical protein
MKVELTEEISVATGTMYCVRVDDSAIKWFVQRESAETFYNEIIANPNILKPLRNILKSEEINVPLEETNQ